MKLGSWNYTYCSGLSFRGCWEKRRCGTQSSEVRRRWVLFCVDVLSGSDTQAIDDQAHLANYDSDNKIENDDLGYHSEEYFDDAHEDYENNHSNGNVVKKGITRISGKHRALISEFFYGNMVLSIIRFERFCLEHVGSEARDKHDDIN
ncbi:hypothetical protein Tco_1263088 [Tanacetum coccineum]